MATTFEEATTVKTEEQERSEIALDLSLRGVNDVGFPETSTVRRLLDSSAKAHARYSVLRAATTYAAFRGLVEQIPAEEGRDAWLDLFMDGQYGLPRDRATKARHRFRLTNASSGLQRTIETNKLRARGGGVDFVNVTVPGALYPGHGTLEVGGILDLLFEAQTPGVIGNVPVGSVSQLVTAIAGVTVSNPAIDNQGSSIVRAARNAESNASLLARGDARWGATGVGGSAGSLIEWIDKAFKYAGVEKTVTKWLVDDTNPLGPGTTVVYLANNAGGATLDELAIVQSFYDLRRTAAMGRLLAIAAIVRTLSYHATLYSNLQNTPAVLAAANAMQQAYTADLAMGGKAIRNQLIEHLMFPDGMVDVSLDFEDVQLEVNEVGVFDGGFERG
jgi:hypothetical protein